MCVRARARATAIMGATHAREHAGTRGQSCYAHTNNTIRRNHSDSDSDRRPETSAPARVPGRASEMQGKTKQYQCISGVRGRLECAESGGEGRAKEEIASAGAACIIIIRTIRRL